LSPVEWVGVVSLLYLLACALQYRYINNIVVTVTLPGHPPAVHVDGPTAGPAATL
jgi:hypothetical protein